MRIFLETDRLLLRYAVAADADDLYRLNSDPKVMRYLSARPATRASTLTEVLPRFMAGPGGAEPRTWIAAEKASGAFLGGFALETPADGPADEAELGYRLRPAAWGKGLATEGARGLIAKGFGVLGLNRIWGQTMAVNLGSRRVMEKAGLVYVRTFHLEWDDPLDGVEHGEVEYALTRDEWLCKDGRGALPGGGPGGIRAQRRSRM
ncbi:MAG TPA: GNAT family N-acetyltransferase [Caulobacteraceae bacterium]